VNEKKEKTRKRNNFHTHRRRKEKPSPLVAPRIFFDRLLFSPQQCFLLLLFARFIAARKNALRLTDFFPASLAFFSPDLISPRARCVEEREREKRNAKARRRQQTQIVNEREALLSGPRRSTSFCLYSAFRAGAAFCHVSALLDFA
jgi:hypothetical protein